VVSFFQALPPNPCMQFSFPHACHISCLFHSPLFDHSNYTWQRVKVMKLLIVQFPPASYYLISLSLSLFSPNFSSAPCSQNLRSPLNVKGPSLTARQNYR
jgi:hypothetical protein